MGRRARATIAGQADRHATDLAARLGAALKDARTRTGLTQTQAAARAGLVQTTWSKLERDRDTRFTLGTWDRAAHAVGTTLSAYLPQASSADQPRDAVHLRNQELVLRTARDGGWRGVPERALDRELTRSRHGDVVLSRTTEWCLVEVVDWMVDVGEAVRDFGRRLAALDRLSVARMRGDVMPKSGGLWLLRATARNRRLVAEHQEFFRGRFPGSGRAWLAAITHPGHAMPAEPALLWIDVKGTRIFAARLGTG